MGSKTAKKIIKKSANKKNYAGSKRARTVKKSNKTIEIPFERSFASSQYVHMWSDENDFTPMEVYKSSNKKYKFKCDVCSHTFEVVLSNMSSRGSCPYCASKKLCDDDNCTFCFQKSFLSSPRSMDWSSENNISPRQVFKSSSKKYKFDCDVCKHQLYISLDYINSKNHFCAYCTNRKLCDNIHCNFCKKRSFQTSSKSKYWSSENNITPRQVFRTTKKKYKFDCNTCKHQFITSPHIIAGGCFCPYCCYPPIKLCENTECDFCYSKSFASNNLSKYWSQLNKVSPRQVFKSAEKKYKFNCLYCDEIYEASPHKISNGRWCKCTKNKTEIKLFKFLKSNYDVKKQKIFDWCKNIKHLPFDFCIKKLKLIIELDGQQHFEQVAKWKTPIEIQQTDLYKMKLANKHGFTVIRIFQEDVWNDKNNWKDVLMNLIKEYDKPTNIYVGSVYILYPIHKDSNPNHKLLLPQK
jgi:very-short-patch-repair endonuclease